MSTASKQVLLREIETALGGILTAGTVTEAMTVISEQLSVFNVEIEDDTGSDSESSELLQAYLEAKQIEGRSGGTINRYRREIQRLYDELRIPVRKISVFHLRKYLSDEKARGLSDSTLDGIRQVFSAYFGWLQKEGLLRENPTVNLGKIKSVKKVRRPYSEVDLEKLRETCSTDRDRAIMALLLSTGCRISEVCRLNRDSIDFDRGEILVLGKGNKERTVFIDDVAVMLVKRYLDSRSDTEEALFVGKGTSRLHPGGVRFMLKGLAQKAGVDNVHPHRFRRTLATNLIDHGMAIQEVAAILGHDKLDTTMKYVYLDKNNVKNAYRRFA